MGGVYLQFVGVQPVISIDYDVVGLELLKGNREGLSTSLTWVNDLGEPDVGNTVVVAGQSLDIYLYDGTLTFARVLAQDFVRGDCNDDYYDDLADGIYILSYLFPQTGHEVAPPSCAASCDSNGDLVLDASDAIYLFNYLLLEGPAPPAPFPACGLGADPATEPCDSQESCGP